MTISFQNIRFLGSALDAKSWQKVTATAGNPLFQIALVGRSNVGKSSLINHLAKQKTLARVSSTPGKTQTLNFFSVDEQLLLIDLPGYGYAKVPKDLKETWGKAISTFLEKNSFLSLILFLIDSRRELEKEDLAFIEWSIHHRRPILLVFTKMDKLSQSEKHQFMNRFANTLKSIKGFRFEHSVNFTIKDPGARQALIKKINEFLYYHPFLEQ
jgi:GTP-binding protein